jgi:hypothetical protein
MRSRSVVRFTVTQTHQPDFTLRRELVDLGCTVGSAEKDGISLVFGRSSKVTPR